MPTDDPLPVDHEPDPTAGGCLDHQTVLNYAGGALRPDFICFGEEQLHEIRVHLMRCEACERKVDVLVEQLRAQAPWFNGCRPR